MLAVGLVAKKRQFIMEVDLEGNLTEAIYFDKKLLTVNDRGKIRLYDFEEQFEKIKNRETGVEMPLIWEIKADHILKVQVQNSISLFFICLSDNKVRIYSLKNGQIVDQL